VFNFCVKLKNIVKFIRTIIPMSFLEQSVRLTKTISKKDKKLYGIYFTPPSCVSETIQLLHSHSLLTDTTRILEPSCGSGEFINQLHQFNPNISITGIELNSTIFNTIRDTYPFVTLHNTNYITYSTDDTYDVIIGNPPFNVIKKTDIESKYHPYIVGRPNIFNLFILKSFELLTDTGVIAFVLPSTFLNSSYYQPTRKYIYDNFKILHIDTCKGKYIDTM
jgi:adenine-specific DNA-methyltransferase